jgi:hypothetical protein
MHSSGGSPSDSGYTSTEDIYLSNRTSPRVEVSPGSTSPRVHLLEAKIVLHQRQLARIDDVSAKTAEVLTLLDSDIANVKSSVQASLLDLQQHLGDSRAADAAALEEELTRIVELVNSAVQAAADAHTAADAATSDVGTLSLQLQALKLGLECVEGEMEELDIRTAVDMLRSRMEDLDANVEKTSAADATRIGDFRCALAGLKADVEESKMAVTAMRALVDAVQEEVAKAAGASATEGSAGFERLRSALATLSHSHNSLLQALTLVHKSQHELSARVSEVGHRAGQEWVPTKKRIVTDADSPGESTLWFG